MYLMSTAKNLLLKICQIFKFAEMSNTSIYIPWPWPFPLVWGVANNRRNNNKKKNTMIMYIYIHK